MAGKKKWTVFTAGYEGLTLAEFMQRLRRNHIQTVIDVRDRPSSRKPGFSKKALQEGLAQGGIEYLHFKELGTPPDLRNKMRLDGDYDYFFQEYLKLIQARRDRVKVVLEIACQAPSCFICYERDPDFCHRKVLVEEMSRLCKGGLEIRNL